jgi:hypothetical protein
MNLAGNVANNLSYLGLTLVLVIGLAVALHYHNVATTAAIAAALASVLERVGSTLTPGRAAAGGGILPSRADVYPWRTWPVVQAQSQLQQTLPSGAEQTTWYNDCGETCASMLVRACRGVTVPPDVLGVYSLTPGSNGLTTAQDLVNILASSQIAAQVVSASEGPALDMLKASTLDGRPVICLGMWPTPGGALHWILALYVESTNRVHYINPWGGNHSWMDWSDWLQHTSNSYVELKSHMLFG